MKMKNLKNKDRSKNMKNKFPPPLPQNPILHLLTNNISSPLYNPKMLYIEKFFSSELKKLLPEKILNPQTQFS